MKKNRILLSAILFLLLAVLLNNFSQIFSNKSRYARKFENVLERKSEMVNKMMSRLQHSGEEEILDIITQCNKEGIILLAYNQDSLLYWTSNTIPVNDIWDAINIDSSIVRFFNSYYHIEKRTLDSITYLGLINIYNSYPYTNVFLVSGFNKDFRLPTTAELGFDEHSGYPVYHADNTYMLSIVVPSETETGTLKRIIAAILLFLGLIFLGIYLFFLLREWHNKGLSIILVLAVPIGLIILRILQLSFNIPIQGFILFNPFIYAESFLAPSLGDLLINSLILFFLALVVTRLFGGEKLQNIQTKKDSLVAMISVNLLFVAFFLYAHYYSYSLIFNSSISFQPGEIDQISVYSLVGFFINGINYLSAGLIMIWMFRLFLSRGNLPRFIPVFILSSAAVFCIIILAFSYRMDIISISFFYLFALLLSLMFFAGRDLSAYSSRVLFLLLFSVYSFLFMNLKVAEKEAISKRSLVLSLANEHDPVAEYLFEDISRQIEKDDYILSQFKQEQIDADVLWDYLKQKYFSGFWNKYDFQITLCRPQDNVLIEVPEFEWFHCYNFFDQIIKEVGFSLPDSRFYYLDNLTGRISYLGRFPFQPGEGRDEITLFVELDSRPSGEFLGYPELLLDERLHEDRLIQAYSYAKYYKGNLVSKHGDFSYSLTADLFGDLKGDYNTVKLDGYNHLIYKSEQDSLIVLSQPETKFIDLLIGFSYIFLFYYFCLLIIMGAGNLRSENVKFLVKLRSKIQFSILSILIISLFLIAGSTIWLNLRNYRQSQLENLQEKVQSVLIELSHKLENEEVLTNEWYDSKYANLDQLLIKFSDVFYTDINLYDLDGNLMATSRYEIFDLGLQGEKMDPMAFHKLHVEKRAQFIHRENIGKLRFVSAYVPFENVEGKELAYLNLPYFTKQSQLQTSISALIVTIFNIYVILILITIVITILISDQITRPLQMLQLKFRELKLGDKHEQIFYKREDEIGSLVKEYNNMVLELEKSVNMLARSERESAWREMAKQIAHEIKNPLTPMRLSVQQLNKIWVDKPKDFDAYIGNVTATLIEQIDNLSAIATEFSNFAKMPIAKFEKVNLVDAVEKAVQLFRGNTAIAIKFTHEVEECPIKADKEQLSRVFINLIKNGIQSIPEGREGKIDIHIQTSAEEAFVSIIDNGRGIPEEIKYKLFMPNFTTKSSGMGLGLAIVQNIIDQLGGTIDFETELGIGSRFNLQLPLYKK